MDFSNFNFANPHWLWALLIIPIGFLWYKYAARLHQGSNLHNFVDPTLLPHILADKAQVRRNNGFAWACALTAVCIVLALANPRWSFTDIDAYQPTASTVILFDLSDAGGVKQARQQIEDLLKNSKGLKVGLVAFAGIAHMVAPITDDLATIKTFLPALDTDIVTRQGDNLQAALKMGTELLASEPGTNKSIILVSSGVFTTQNYQDVLKSLNRDKIDLYVLGVGDQNSALLKEIAKQGHGYFMVAEHTDKAVNSILNKIQGKYEHQQIADGKIRQWEDRYYWLLLPVVALFVYFFRPGVLMLLIACAIAPQAEASMFKNQDQQAVQEFKNAEYDKAAELFTADYNKGVALYRSGKFADAEAVFKKDKTIAALYNAGNAQMQQQKWQAAIKSYEAVLAKDPDHLDAKHNLEIARSYVRESNEQINSEVSGTESEATERNSEDTQIEKNIDSEEGNSQPGGLGAEDRSFLGDMTNKDDDVQQQQQMDDEQLQIDSMERQEVDELKQQDQQEEQINQSNQQQGAQPQKEEDASKLWLNRIDSDIKVLLRNKFYIEGTLSEN